MRHTLALATNLGLILAMGFLPTSPACGEERIWAETAIAAVQVGVLPDHVSPRYRVASLGAVAPATLYHPMLVTCIAGALDSTKEQLRFELEAMPGYGTIIDDLAASGTSVSIETLNTQRDVRSKRVATAMASATAKLRQGIIACAGPSAEAVANKVSVAFAFRECPADAVVCRWKSTAAASPHRHPAAFERIYSWATVTEPRPVNAWLQPLTDSTGAALGGITPRPSVTGAVNWPSVIPSKQALVEFEEFVVNARKRGEQDLSYVVPAVLGLRRETALRVLDELQHPFAAVANLPAGADVLNTLSDELGRSRLRDCSQLRGNTTVERIGACAGFTIAAPEVFACLGGQRCLPALADEARADLLAIRKPMDLAALLDKTQLPRIGFADGKTYGQWLAAADKCTGASTAEARNDCLMKGTLAPSDYAMVACVRDAHAIGKPEALLGCAEGLASNEQKALIGCLRQGGQAPESVAYCAAKQNIPTNFQPAISCLESHTGAQDVTTCIAGASLGADAKRVMECYQANTSSPKAAVICSVAGKLPKDAQEVVGCVQENAGSWQGAAACMAAKKLALSGDLGRVVACGMTSGGSVVGTAACAAGSGLRPEQAIVLQCAATASTGVGFAVCTGGLLAFNEFNQCKGNQVGEGNCFGENNEIRRFVRALGLPDIGPSSVVAQYGNLVLKVTRFYVALAEGGLKDAGDLAKAVVNVAEQAIEVVNNARNEINRAGRNVVRCVSKPWKC